MLPWLTGIVCLAAFVWLWFKMSYKELVARKRALESEKNQYQLVLKQVEQLEAASFEKKAQERLENELILYEDVKEKYETARKKYTNRIPASIFGFDSFTEIKLKYEREKL